MKFSIKESPGNEFIVIKAMGKMTRQNSMKLNTESHAYGKSVGINKYLVDLTESKNIDSAVNSYEFANKDMQSDSIDRKAVIALLVDPNDDSHDFIETVSKNAGLNVTLFKNRKLAEDYLKSEK